MAASTSTDVTIEGGSAGTPPRSLACLGDSGDPRAWSSIPYHFSRAGLAAGFITHTLDLTDPRYARRRMVWNLLAPLRLERPGGYQYSRDAARRMWERMPAALRGGEVVSHFQPFPPPDEARRAGLRHSFYCDATLRELWYEGGQAKGIGRRTQVDMLRREQEAYQSARYYVAMGRHNALSVIRDYGVDPRNVYVVRPGANMDEPAVRAYLAGRGPSWREAGEPFTQDRPARLGLVGMWPERKGLPRLVAAAEVLARRGRPVKVNVIGQCPEHLRGHPQVEWVGVVNKARDLDRFLREVDRFALGCLPSHFEPLGISTLEALRLGVPVMGADTGGIPDCVPSGAGFLVPRDAGGEEIADAIEYHVFDPGRYAALRAAAVLEAPDVTWEVTVQRFQEIWAGKAKPFDPAAVAPAAGAGVSSAGRLGAVVL